MTQWDLIAQLIDKFGLPGAVLLVLAWAMYRFGPTPTPHKSEPSTTAAIEKLSDELAAMSKEMTDRLARVETNIANIQRGQR